MNLKPHVESTGMVDAVEVEMTLAEDPTPVLLNHQPMGPSLRDHPVPEIPFAVGGSSPSHSMSTARKVRLSPGK
jgi:hypothetical protein